MAGDFAGPSAGSWSGEIHHHSPVAITRDRTFSQKLCSTQRRKKLIIAKAPSRRGLLTRAHRPARPQWRFLVPIRFLARRPHRRQRHRRHIPPQLDTQCFAQMVSIPFDPASNGHADCAPFLPKRLPAIASVSSVIPIPARCRRSPAASDSTGFIDSGRKQAAGHDLSG